MKHCDWNCPFTRYGEPPQEIEAMLLELEGLNDDLAHGRDIDLRKAALEAAFRVLIGSLP